MCNVIINTHHYKMKKDNKVQLLQIENNILRQMLQLTGGIDAVDKANKLIKQQQTDKALEIADANEFDNYIKEIAILR